MPACKNGSGSYTGKEQSPKGRGYCSRHEKIGTKMRGKDRKMWVVKSIKLASGKRSRRWFKVLPPAKKSKAKPTKHKKPMTKKRKASQTRSKRSYRKKVSRKRIRGGNYDQNWEKEQEDLLKTTEEKYGKIMVNGKSMTQHILDLYMPIINYARLVVLPKEFKVNTTNFQAMVDEAQKAFTSAMSNFRNNILSQIGDQDKENEILNFVNKEVTHSARQELYADMYMHEQKGMNAQQWYDQYVTKTQNFINEHDHKSSPATSSIPQPLPPQSSHNGMKGGKHKRHRKPKR